jgi:hypothetical protein
VLHPDADVLTVMPGSGAVLLYVMSRSIAASVDPDAAAAATMAAAYTQHTCRMFEAGSRRDSGFQQHAVVVGSCCVACICCLRSVKHVQVLTYFSRVSARGTDRPRCRVSGGCWRRCKVIVTEACWVCYALP